jgi:hypothetical protein
MEAGDPSQVAIVVPFSEWNEWVLECVSHCARLSEKHWTLWLLPDTPPSPSWCAKLDAIGLGKQVRVEPTGPGNPARKRNVALRKSDATIFALVDSDAWPQSDWLVKGLSLLQGNVAVVTGPNLTPPDDPLSRRVSGRVMESPLGFGMAYIRHVPVKRRIVREMPTCNMVLRRLDGLLFREDMDTAEDMMYCAEVRERGMTILYDPDVVVFHHRRQLGRAFFAQFYRYGLDKGALARQRHTAVYRWQAMPAFFFLYLVGLTATCVWPLPLAARWAAWGPMLLYGGAIVWECCRIARSGAELLLAPAGFLAAHLGYGIGYLGGFFRRT